MIIASQKRKENIAEYLLYMWQIEDLIRAYGLDIDKIRQYHIDRIPDLDDEKRREMTGWYESLIDMMRREGITERGHLQMNRNTMNQLVELHRALLADPKFSDYSAEFYRTLPYIVDLRSRAGAESEGEIETCFTALYGLLLLRLQGKEISEQTRDALKQISKFIATLSGYFHKNEQEPIFKND
ncbi:MAG: DUF4924 family protein [Muribaculaceae bacterium]|nr:DUF4924 family protein [Muribaculaceae bacterium]